MSSIFKGRSVLWTIGWVTFSWILAGCRGPAGPMGPSGSASPVYLFSQNFDSYTSGATYTGNQFVVVDPNSAGMSPYITNDVFVSAPNSFYLDWYANPGNGAGMYTASGVFPVPANTDCYFDVYVNLSSLSTSGEEAELVLNLNNSTVADLGFDINSSASTSAYTYNNGVVSTLATGLPTGHFHHVILSWNHSTGKSGVTLDGDLLAQNITGTRTPQPSGAAGTSVGVYFPVGVPTAQNGVYLDNITVYHY